MNSDNITFLKDTLTCINRGYYFFKNDKKPLASPKNKIEDALVFLPEDIAVLRNLTVNSGDKKVKCTVYDTDAFSAARQIKPDSSEKPVLVLNFANAIHAGGGVRQGSRAQEEDLCRTSTLLLSLESVEAQKYYSYNRKIHSHLGSDAVIVSPHVEVFRDRRGGFLEKPFETAVLTCAAPDLKRYGEIDKNEYIDLFTRRIESVFLTAAYLGYKKLVLGAWGCGAFANSPRLVSDMFFSTVTRFELFGSTVYSLFDEIVFAVPYGKTDHSNFYEFNRNFCDFRIPSIENKNALCEARCVQDAGKTDNYVYSRVMGCLVGGAAGDALGYPVEFLTNSGIKGKFGKNGICSYVLDNGKALISDDTQMLLFTAQGVLAKNGKTELNIAKSYLEWYKTQTCQYESLEDGQKNGLLAYPQLFELRAPGNACLASLEKRSSAEITNPDFISEHINMSKGCGGIMRAAPCAFCEFPAGDESYIKIAKIAAQSAAITHGHPLGYMSSAVLSVIIAKCLVRNTESLKDIILGALKINDEIFAGEKYLEQLDEAVLNAVKLSANGKDDSVNLRKIGEGWVAEETLAIAVYCALKYCNDFSSGIIAAVNHSGDSDSTGAVTGNILGAYLGIEAIDEKWEKSLELYELICNIADKCSEKLIGEPEVPDRQTEKSKKIMLFAGSVMEAQSLSAVADYLCGEMNIIFCAASPEDGIEKELVRSGYSAEYNIKTDYTDSSDYAADLIPAFSEILKTQKPDAVLCVSSAQCGFACAMAASRLDICTIAISCGIRFDKGSRDELMRSACDGSATWRVAANSAAYNTLIDEGFEKESIILPDAEYGRVMDRIKGIINNGK